MDCDTPGPEAQAASDFLGAALWYAGLGLPVFPVYGVVDGHCACDDPACTSPGKHPHLAHGFKDATLDPDIIRKWWSQWPAANIGVAVPEDHLIVDVDDTSGENSLRQAGIVLDSAPCVRTGGGGRHLWFRTTTAFRPKVGVLPHVDLRTFGSYVVVPPSVHLSGRRYTWEIELDEIPEAPQALITLFKANSAPRVAAADVADAPIPEGQRNHMLTSLAGTMRKRGMAPETIEAALLEENRRRSTPPLTEDEVRAIAQSVSRYASAATGTSPAGTAPAETHAWKFLTVPELAQATQGADIEWVLRGILARRYVTLLPALWKSGKTTLATHGVKAIAEGRAFCGLPVTAGSVTIISEENTSTWNVRARTIKLGDGVDFLLRPFPKGRPTFTQWQTLAEFIAEHARDRILIIFDSIHNLWGVEQENDNAEQLRWLEPLHAITDAGAALLLVAHPSKALQNEGRSTRGGGAIGGWVDIILEFRRYDPDDPGNRMRVLTGFSRFDETPQELVVELADGEYRAVGTRADVKISVRQAEILAMLPAQPPGKSARQVHDEWPHEKRPGQRTIETDLAALFRQGTIIRTGAGGNKADPYRFHKR